VSLQVSTPASQARSPSWQGFFGTQGLPGSQVPTVIPPLAVVPLPPPPLVPPEPAVDEPLPPPPFVVDCPAEPPVAPVAPPVAEPPPPPEARGANVWPSSIEHDETSASRTAGTTKAFATHDIKTLPEQDSLRT
jgi:hypothetical protein